MRTAITGSRSNREDEFEDRPTRSARARAPRDEDFDEEPPRRARASRDEDFDEEPRGKSRRAPVEDDDLEPEDVAPRGKSRRAPVEEDLEPEEIDIEDAAPAPRSRRRAPVEDDDLEPEDVAPRGKSRRAPVEEDLEPEEAPRGKSKRNVEPDEDLEPEEPAIELPVKEGDYVVPSGSRMWLVEEDPRGAWIKGEAEDVKRKRTVVVAAVNNETPVGKAKNKAGQTHVVVEYNKGLYLVIAEELLTTKGKPAYSAEPEDLEEEAPRGRGRRAAAEVDPEDVEPAADDSIEFDIDNLTKKQKKLLSSALTSLYGFFVACAPDEE